MVAFSTRFDAAFASDLSLAVLRRRTRRCELATPELSFANRRANAELCAPIHQPCAHRASTDDASPRFETHVS